jgi:ABC-2 type transport system ATP-binding protein
MSVTDYLKYMGTLRGMPPRAIKARIDDVVGVCRLEDYRKTIIGKLSKGFRQRVGIAQAIMHEPEVLVLDEPTIGIDPIQVVETRRLIEELGKSQTVVLSSHILPEVSMICERVLIINEGRIVAEDTPKNLAEGLEGIERLEIEIGGPVTEVLPALRRIKGVSRVAHRSLPQKELYTVHVDPSVESGTDIRDEISKAVISSGWSLLSLQTVGMSLEEIFLKLTTHEDL